MPLIKFRLNPTQFRRRCGFNNFKIAAIGNLGYQNRTILAILNLHNTPNAYHQVSAQSNLRFDRRRLKNFKMVTVELNDFSNPESLCRLNASHQLSSAQSHLQVWSRFSRWPPWWPSWIPERNDYSYSKFPCWSNAFHQVSAQSNLPFRRRQQ